MNKKSFILLLLVLVMVVPLFATPASAVAVEKRLDNIVIRVGDKDVVVEIRKYVEALIDGDGELYDYLKSEDGVPKISAVVSNEKYMEIGNYIGVVIDNDGDVALAIEEASSIPQETVNTFFIFVDFDEDNKVILKLNQEVEPELNTKELEAAKLVANAKSKAEYTEESYAKLTAALALAETTQEEINAKVEAINEAVKGLATKE